MKWSFWSLTLIASLVFASGAFGQQLRQPISIAALPPGVDDVGDCTHEQAWAAVNTALHAAG